MQSIFNLKTSTDELESSNYGISKDLYEQITPTRDVTLANFANGAINFRWQTGGTKWWIPNRSYLRFRIKLTKAITDQPLVYEVDDVGPIMNQCSALFQSAEFRINDKTVSRISDYLPQIDTLNTRLNKSKAWLDSVGASTNFWQDQFQVRQQQVCRDGEAYPNGVVDDAKYDQLGYPADVTHAFNSTTGVVTFASPGGDPIPASNTVWVIGDLFQVTGSNVGGGAVGYPGIPVYMVSEISPGANAAAIRLQGVSQRFSADGAATAATTAPFYRRRGVNTARRVTEYEVTWTPALSIFGVEHAIPSGRFELVLNPQTSAVYKKAVVESRDTPAEPGAGNQFDLSIQDMYLYINTVEGSRVDNMTYYLDLEQISCQAESLSGAVTFGQKNFDVSPSTKALAVAFQDSRAGTNTLYSPTTFRAYDTLPRKDVCQNLNRFFINYAGVSKPQIDADPNYLVQDPGVAPPGDGSIGIDRTTQRYVESLINSGSYHDTGGSETLQEWQNRGSYYLFGWNKDGNDRSTRVAVHTGFKTGTVLNNARLLLFSISNQIAKVVISNGSVTDVQVEDA